MTKMIKMSSLVAMVLLLGGMLFKNQHWPGADALLIAGVASGIFSAIFMISSFAGKLTSGLEKINIIFSSLTIAVVLLTFVFKVLHWPGAAKLVWIADIGIALSALLFLIDGIREKDPLKSGLKIMAMFFLLFLLMLIVLSH
jgi:hypothetical protein